MVHTFQLGCEQLGSTLHALFGCAIVDLLDGRICHLNLPEVVPSPARLLMKLISKEMREKNCLCGTGCQLHTSSVPAAPGCAGGGRCVALRGGLGARGDAEALRSHRPPGGAVLPAEGWRRGTGRGVCGPALLGAVLEPRREHRRFEL